MSIILGKNAGLLHLLIRVKPEIKPSPVLAPPVQVPPRMSVLEADTGRQQGRAWSIQRRLLVLVFPPGDIPIQYCLFKVNVNTVKA